VLDGELMLDSGEDRRWHDLPAIPQRSPHDEPLRSRSLGHWPGLGVVPAPHSATSSLADAGRLRQRRTC
jgi:hypothetical protein